MAVPLARGAGAGAARVLGTGEVGSYSGCPCIHSLQQNVRRLAPGWQPPPRKALSRAGGWAQCHRLRQRPSPSASASQAQSSANGGASPSASEGQPRPVVILPGLGNNTSDYDGLKSSLEARGLPCTVADVARADWLRNAAGLLDADYWRGTLKPRPVLDWYLARIVKAVATARGQAGGRDARVSLVGHSAGGWLARLYLAEFGIEDVAQLLTLGTPHIPPPRGVPGVVDQTRGLLYYIEDACPGAFHAPDVHYVCVSGRYIKGSPLLGPGSSQAGQASDELATAVAAVGAAATLTEPAAAIAPVLGPKSSAAAAEASAGTSEEGGSKGTQPGAPGSLQARIIGLGYKQVCGSAVVWGDGVVPEPSALLPGAIHIIVDGVYHSPVGASRERPWYGSEEVLPFWVDHLLPR